MFTVLGGLMAVAEIVLTLYFWTRVGLSVQHLSMPHFVGNTVTAVLSILLVVGGVLLTSSASA